ncbi:MAG: hypothetical protein A2126_01470 [Candidatus Woykebacteria bacterium GWB1_45_5]|uniref:Uncharacterized protein n=2 Tax=Candidatus Woykeibacteriota TaxID=1817899 RepID=A0A1G1W254_9BACT|nr:MAG: hypothetical protein A2113_04175 [Candidatus Woykebacteria bacterium GWA1_44_8]OGY23732.1 MAG: hypothetical protein A2126_01470 [Candidatus Woykebacteria bacterium GWB1_45_5]
MKEEKVRIRQATLDDIPQMVEVDQRAWWDEVAFTAEHFESQIRTYPQGVLVAEAAINGRKRLVGTICGLRISSALANSLHNWSEATGNGYFTTHIPNGNVMFGANLSVLPEFGRKGIGDKLFGHAAAVIVRQNVPYLIFGGRLPDLAEYNRKRIAEDLSKVTGEEYAALRDGQGRILDDELRFYLRQPFMEMIRVLPEYFPDPESENYGVLLKWHNPLYKLHLGWLYRIPLLGRVIGLLGASIIRVLV